MNPRPVLPLRIASLSLQPLSIPRRWAVLLVVSCVAGAILEWLRVPAALMLGPMVAAVLVQRAGGAVKVPHIAVGAAQAVIGCLIARSITTSFFGDVAKHWPVLLGVVLLSLAASVAIGWAMSRFRIVPGTTAVWGMLPGGATVMMVMAEAYGADFRLVAFMQYLRVVLVAGGASVIALFFAHGEGGHFATGYFPPVDLLNLVLTAAIALAGAALGYALRIPAGTLLGPMVLGGALNALGLVSIELPPILLICSYALIGWSTGLRFTRDVLQSAVRAFPICLGAVILMMTLCGMLAWMLVVFLRIDPLTAYLATSPGGVDAAAILAASTNVDLPFVMALQTVRVIILLGAGPYVARWIAGTLMPGAPVPQLQKLPSPDDFD